MLILISTPQGSSLLLFSSDDLNCHKSLEKWNPINRKKTNAQWLEFGKQNSQESLCLKVFLPNVGRHSQPRQIQKKIRNQNEAHGCFDALNTLAFRDLPHLMQGKISIMLERINGPVIGFSCMGLFAITKGTLLNVLGVITTFFLTVLQIKVSNQ
ncbi:uncharacterized protein LOC111619543 isoform X2 [Centruroides sculpturatus]|uniref:uncharacterized protein LOC111619543 isoform X2 n=1 Tax=Centruroides sculpturatus TaxID=218467 RepID=UPI000C6EAD3D|nr:uncharacterized protein LOC111619543 isoform X2 [Centruroides sculpturatus]